jgi:hypothetical protein
MTKAKRRRPDPEWAQMYRLSIPTQKIAAIAGAAESSVRYHLHVVAQAEPGRWETHRKALGAVTRITSAGLRNLNDKGLPLSLRQGRRPASTKGASARERALAI